MSTKKDQRFIEPNLRIELKNVKDYPPEHFEYGGYALTLLGQSNKIDLMPINITDPELAKAVTFGAMGQFIYSSPTGDLYDACIYKDGNNTVYLYAIRTRQFPDKKKVNVNAGEREQK